MAALTTALLVGVGLAASAAGTVTSIEASKQNAEYQEQAIAAEQRAEQQRKQAMELDARRRQLEILRTQQRARALGLATATAQGAQFGSGLQGAYGQISGQSNTNATGVSQNLQIGENIFAANADLSQARMGMANAQSIGAIGLGLNNFGHSLMGAVPQLNALSKGFSFGSNTTYNPSSFASGYNTVGGIWPA